MKILTTHQFAKELLLREDRPLSLTLDNYWGDDVWQYLGAMIEDEPDGAKVVFVPVNKEEAA